MKCTREEQKTMVEAYKSGATQVVASALIGRSQRATTTALRKAGVPSRKTADVCRVHRFNDAFFDNLTPESAYWLGFIAADGSVTPNQLRVCLAVKDKPHLQTFAERIGASKSRVIEYEAKCAGKTYPAVRLLLCSKHLCGALAAYGVIQNKTATLQPPNVPKPLIPHFWRGFFDGDGCATIDRKGNLHLSLVGMFNMCHGFLAWLRSEGIITRAVAHKRRNHYEATIGGRIVTAAAADAMRYNQGLVELRRKADVILKASKTDRSTRRKFNGVTKEHLCRLYEENNGSWANVAKALGVRKQVVSNLRGRLGFAKLAKGRPRR